MNEMIEYQTLIEQQFDSFCKKALRNYAKDIYRQDRRWNEKYISLERLTPSQLNELHVSDTYEIDETSFWVYEYEISINDLLIAQVIATLPQKQKDIILLSFFLEMREQDIAIIMNLARRTINYHKQEALKKLKHLLEREY